VPTASENPVQKHKGTKYNDWEDDQNSRPERIVQSTVELPNDLTQHADAAREAVQAVAIAGYRAGSLTAYEVQRLLGFQTRFEVEGYLKERAIHDHACDAANLDKDMENALSVARKRKGD
jgi:Uncharacterised protein family (UPF0175)